MQEVFEKVKERLHKEDLEFMQQADVMQCIDAVIEQAAGEYNNGWIPVRERLPEEHDSVFARFKGTNRWNNQMFERVSEEVNVTVADKKDMRVTTHAHTVDGKWSCDLLSVDKSYRIIAWQPLPEPYQPKGE